MKDRQTHRQLGEYAVRQIERMSERKTDRHRQVAR